MNLPHQVQQPGTGVSGYEGQQVTKLLPKRLNKLGLDSLGLVAESPRQGVIQIIAFPQNELED